MRTQLIKASATHYKAHIEKHKMNIEVLLNYPRAIDGHVDIMDAIEKEIALMAEYEDKLQVLEKYFPYT
jgi:hypothetical protein